jgi:hypothetical protein
MNNRMCLVVKLDPPTLIGSFLGDDKGTSGTPPTPLVIEDVCSLNPQLSFEWAINRLFFQARLMWIEMFCV